jgi:hypothetical protein
VPTTETYLEPGNVRVWRLPGGSARAQVGEDRTVLRAQFRLLFPLSNAERYILVQDGDKKEVGILRTLDGMDEDSRKVVEEELDRRYFTPCITRITKLVADAGMWEFEVETDRGPSKFYVRNWRDSAHEIGANRWLVHSVDGQRYEIPKTESLDARSQDLLEQLL